MNDAHAGGLQRALPARPAGRRDRHAAPAAVSALRGCRRLRAHRPRPTSTGRRASAPEVLNAATIASRLAKPSLPTASMPPASKKFLAKVARAVKSASVPRLARKIFGRAPVCASMRSEASRSASNGSARRMRRQRLERAARPDRAQARHRRNVEHRHRRLGEIGKIARAGERILAPRDRRLRARRAPRRPCSGSGRFRARPRRRPPARSPGTAPRPRGRACRSDPRCRRSRRRDRPPCARFDSSSRTSCVLRAMRRAKRSGRPSARGERQHRDGVGAAEAGGEDRDGRAQHVHVGVALGHHPPGGLGGDEGGLRRERRRPPRRAPTVFAARGTWRWSGTGRRRRRAGSRSCAARHRARCRPPRARADRRRATAST